MKNTAKSTKTENKAGPYQILASLAHAGDNSTYAGFFANGKLIMDGMEGWHVDPVDPHFAARALFAMTIGRAAYSKERLLDAKEAAEALGLPASSEGTPALPHGYYLLDASKKSLAAAFASNIPSMGIDEITEIEKSVNQLRQDGKAHKECFITSVDFDPTILFSEESLFADAISSGFPEQSLKTYGIMATTRKSNQISMKPGYPYAWRGHSRRDLSNVGISDDFDIEAPISDLAKLPFINHKGQSSSSNIRAFKELNDSSQISDRESIIQGMAETWVESQLILNGALDKECGIDPDDFIDPDEITQARADHAKARKNALGNAKKLSHKISSSFMSTKETDVLFMSTDMSIIDGQHSSRNYALIAYALEHSKAPVWWHEKKKAIPISCDPKSFADAVEKSLIRKGKQLLGVNPTQATAQKACLKAMKLDCESIVPKADNSAYAAFRTFTLERVAKVTNTPVTTSEHAKSMVVESNASTPIPKAASTESSHQAFFHLIAQIFNKQAKEEHDKARLVPIKDVHGDSMISTNTQHSYTIEQIFSPLLAIAIGKRQADNFRNSKKDQATDAVQRLLALRKGSKKMGEAIERMLDVFQTASLARQRSFLFTDKNSKNLKDKLIESGALDSSNSVKKLQSFASLAVHQACISILGLPMGIDRKISGAPEISSGKQVYALVKSAMKFQRQLDEQWALISESKKSLAGFFKSKATFENWMLLGVSAGYMELSSNEALNSVERAVSNLLTLRDNHIISPDTNHNKARQGFETALNKNAEDYLGTIGDELMLILYDAQPNTTAPSAIEAGIRPDALARILQKRNSDTENNKVDKTQKNPI